MLHPGYDCYSKAKRLHVGAPSRRDFNYVGAAPSP